MDLSHTSELMLYCDILEMNISVCSLLIKLAGSNVNCLGTILHTKDCMGLFISLLDPKAYSKYIILMNKSFETKTFFSFFNEQEIFSGLL